MNDARGGVTPRFLQGLILSINWQLIGAVIAFAAQSVFFTYTVTEKYKDLQTDIALVRQDVGFLRGDVSKLERRLEGNTHAAVFPISR